MSLTSLTAQTIHNGQREQVEESGLEVGWGQEAGGVCSPLATGSLDSAPLTTTNWALIPSVVLGGPRKDYKEARWA